MACADLLLIHGESLTSTVSLMPWFPSHCASIFGTEMRWNYGFTEFLHSFPTLYDQK